MGMMEKLKDKATELAGKHGEQIDHGLDKVGQAIDKATKGKYSEKIGQGAEKAKHAVDDLAAKGQPPQGSGPSGTATPG
ncbi:antitoxin [Peterkaempfera griseoplana]|uniref:antitoxin n=1 Tax=Peterkaempfera griseoplana TaxID=66896 RepID=UPI0006E28173|nr:antitoxin [Peterkaempfera griseoplana]